MVASLLRSVKLSWRRSQEPASISLARQLVEMAVLLVVTGLGPGNYHKYRLWQKSFLWEDKLGFWHDQKYYAFLDRVNPQSYRMMARNKVIAKALLRFYGIPDAEYIAYLSKYGGVTADGSELGDHKELLDLLNDKPHLTRVCFKPVEGSGGDGFCAAEIIRGDDLALRNLPDGVPLPLLDYIDRYLKGCSDSDYIVEAYLEQHPDLAIFNPSSLNTLRIWVGRSPEGKIGIVGMYLRVGQRGSLVDNRLSGGFGVRVDAETFVTQDAVPQDGSGWVFSTHPDSGLNMMGRKLPFAAEVTALSKKVLHVLPSVRFVGLDVAFTEAQPVLIEFNLAPTAIGACVLGRSHASLLRWIEE